MKLLKTISNKDFGTEGVDESNLRFREAARAVIIDRNNNVAIISVTNGSYHKIPGGGIEQGEDAKLALMREAKEEAGVDIEIIGEVGSILEFRDGLKQYSYCYLANVVGKINQPEFTKSEQRDGFSAPEWLPIAEAVDIFSNDKPTFLRAQFMSLRDGTFIKEASKLLEKF